MFHEKGLVMKQSNSIFIVLLLVCFFVISAFFFPRWLVSSFGEAHFISSYLYIYGSGIPFFIVGLYLLIRSKALNLKAPGEKKWLWFFILGLTWAVTAHGLWIFTAVYFPFKGVF